MARKPNKEIALEFLRKRVQKFHWIWCQQIILQTRGSQSCGLLLDRSIAMLSCCFHTYPTKPKNLLNVTLIHDETPHDGNCHCDSRFQPRACRMIDEWKSCMFTADIRLRITACDCLQAASFFNIRKNSVATKMFMCQSCDSNKLALVDFEPSRQLFSTWDGWRNRKYKQLRTVSTRFHGSVFSGIEPCKYLQKRPWYSISSV